MNPGGRGERGSEQPMIDVHSHILPMVDDGAEDIEEAIEIARIYEENGVEKAIATPHFIEGTNSSTKEKNSAILDRLNEALADNGINLRVYLGNEIYVTMDVLKYLKDGLISSLNSSRYLLIELPMLDIPLYIEQLIYQLLLKGYVPVIAHPERNARIVENPNILYDLITKGALAQLNLPSLEGMYGEEVKSTGEILLKHNMIHFVGTDIHMPHGMASKIKRSIEILKSFTDLETLDRITNINSQCILDNKPIEVDSPIQYKKQRSFLYFLKSKLNLGGDK